MENAPDGEAITELVREDGGTPEQSRAVAVIERSPRHFHKRMVEVYRVLHGSLTLHVDNEVHHLETGEQFRIDPERRHWAESDPDDPAWVEVTCTPAFTAADYFLEPLARH